MPPPFPLLQLRVVGDEYVVDELFGRNFPAVTERMRPDCVAIKRQRMDKRGPEIPIHDANTWLGEHIDGAAGREGGDRQTAGQGFEQDEAEGVGEARKHEHIGGREMRGQRSSLQQAQVLGVGKIAAQIALRCAAAAVGSGPSCRPCTPNA